jgi:hypothetical protein
VKGPKNILPITKDASIFCPTRTFINIACADYSFIRLRCYMSIEILLLIITQYDLNKLTLTISQL